MSEQDQDKIVGRITRNIMKSLVIPVLVVLIASLLVQGWIDRRTERKYTEEHWTELYRLTAELSTTQAMYMKANDEDKVELGKRIDNLVRRMDRFADHDTKRGVSSNDKQEKEYGLEFTPLLE